MEDQLTEAAPRHGERRDARENRARIMEMARKIFAEQGVASTSMREIARAAGVGQGTLYRHFANKGTLCNELVEEELTAFKERVGMLISGGAAAAPPLERLGTLIVEKNRLTETHLQMFSAMDEAGIGPGRGERFGERFHVWLHERICALLDEAVAWGEARPLDHALIADALVASMGPGLYRRQREEDGHSPERIAAGLRSLFVEGLRRCPSEA